jgi:hypothetical protein
LVSDTRFEKIVIKPYDSQSQAEIEATNIFEPIKIERKETVTGIDAEVHNFVLKSDPEEVFKGFLKAGENAEITFNEPCENLVASEGTTIVESGINYAVLNVTWLAGLRASFNFTDCNRIENNSKFISDIYGGIPGMTFKTDWNVSDILTVSDIQRIVQNVAKLREFCTVHDDTPKVPELPINTIEKLNDLEKILYDIHYVYENEKGVFARDDAVYGAEIYCGDEIGDL